MAIVAILGEPVLHGFQLLAQAAYLLTVLLEQGILLRKQLLLLLDTFVSLRQVFPQHPILFSQIDQFFFDRHACSLPALTPFGKSPAHLGSYDLVITPDGESEITVDNLEIAQFIYLLLNNQNIRQVIDTITSQVVLILGRFKGERKTVAERVKQELSTQNYSPVVFDLEEPNSQDFSETMRTLANMARFVLIDLTDVGDILNEIVRVVPHCRVPMQPLLSLDDHPYKYSQFLDLRREYRWVLPLYRYQDNLGLLASFREKIIQLAEERRKDLQKEIIQLFFCYALEDAKRAAGLKKSLSLLERSGQIALWDAQQLAPGNEKEREIEKHLSEAHIILLLVSPDFLASNDCVVIQEKAMERYEQGDATVIPLILRSCGWQSTPLSKLQVLPRDKKPLVRRNLDSILFEVTNEIVDVIKKLL